MLELMQLLIGMSIRRYFPPIGTAGLARTFVSGKRRVPCPPPMITARISFVDGTLSSFLLAGLYRL